MDGGASRRSLVGSSRLVPPCRGWAWQTLARVQPVQLVRAFGGGPPPHGMTHHDSLTPPRRARPTRRAPHPSQAVRWSWHCRGPPCRARCRLRARARRTRCARRDCPGASRGPSYTPALALAPASRTCTSVCAPHPTTTLTRTLVQVLCTSLGLAATFRGASDEFGRHACVRWGGARGRAFAGGVGRLWFEVTRISTRERSQGPPSTSIWLVLRTVPLKTLFW